MLPLEPDYVASLELPPLALDFYAEPALVVADKPLLDAFTRRLEVLWPAFMEVAGAEGIFDELGLNPAGQTWEVELTMVGNPAMHALNREYRRKDQPTDVLTFTLLADAPDKRAWMQLPAFQLGSIFISLDWAREELPVDAFPDMLPRYLAERFVHGVLHLMGTHHDTMSAYERVVEIQKRVLDASFQ